MGDEQIGQDEIEKLLHGAQQAAGDAEDAPSLPESDSPSAGDTLDVAMDQSDIEALLAGGPAAATSDNPAAASNEPAGGASPVAPSVTDSVSQTDLELLLSQAEAAIASIDEPTELPPGVAPFAFNDFGGTPASTESATLELVRDVQLDLKIELGRTHMHLEDVLHLRRGAVVPLDKLAGDPVDVFVNGRMIARGEILVLNDNFCIRITELIVGDSACA